MNNTHGKKQDNSGCYGWNKFSLMDRVSLLVSERERETEGERKTDSSQWRKDNEAGRRGVGL